MVINPLSELVLFSGRSDREKKEERGLFMKRKKAEFNDEFRLEAVNLVLSSGRSAESVSEELGIGSSTLKKWVGNYRNGNLKLLDQPEKNPDKLEIQRLKRELERARKEAEILKKAVAFVARDHI
jgi:transposase